MSDELGVSAVGQKIAEVMKQVDRIPKRGHNDFHNYDYVLEADLVEHLRPLMLDAGLVMLPSQGERTTRQVPTSSGETTVTEILHTFTILDWDTGESVEIRVWGAGADGQDKGPYKAFTGAQKYALMKAFMVATGDDPEHDAHSPRSRPQKKQGRPPKQPKQSSGAEAGARTCPDCDGPIWDNRDDKKAGKVSKKYPNFKCQDRECDWVSWDDASEIWEPAVVTEDLEAARGRVWKKLGEWIHDPDMREKYWRAYARDRVDQDDDPKEWDVLACQRALDDLRERGMEALEDLEPVEAQGELV